MAIIMSKDCLEAIYGLMGWKGLKTNNRGEGVVVDGEGSPCRMSIIRNSNVPLSNLRTPHVAMSIRPKKGRVAMSILGVYTHNDMQQQHKDPSSY